MALAAADDVELSEAELPASSMAEALELAGPGQEVCAVSRDSRGRIMYDCAEGQPRAPTGGKWPHGHKLAAWQLFLQVTSLALRA